MWRLKCKCFFIFLLCFLLLSIPTFKVSAELPGKPFFPILNQSFNQYIEVSYNKSLLNQTFDIEKTILIPLDIYYWTDVPQYLYGSWLTGRFPKTIPIFFLLHNIGNALFVQKNTLLFGSPMPQQYLYINVTNEPAWANTTILTEIIPVDITQNDVSNYDPQKNSSREIAEHVQADLIISPFEEAPSQQYTITISIDAPEKGMVKRTIFLKTITFTPSFDEKIEINIDRAVRFANPNEAVNFNIMVSNKGNKKTRITPLQLTGENLSNYNINPQFMDISPNASGTFVFSAIMPNEFGWKDETRKYTLQFMAETFPLKDNPKKSGYYEIELSINTYGFALIGFETWSIICTLLFVSIIRFYKKNTLRTGKKRDFFDDY